MFIVLRKYKKINLIIESFTNNNGQQLDYAIIALLTLGKEFVEKELDTTKVTESKRVLAYQEMF